MLILSIVIMTQDFHKIFEDEEIEHYALTGLHSAVNLLCWGKLVVVFTISSHYGPLVRIIYLMAKEVFKYVIMMAC